MISCTQQETLDGRVVLVHSGCLLVAVTVGLIALSGCSDGRPERVKVSGQVLIDDQPLTHGNIKFVPSGARPSAGIIDENGNFTLTCYDGNDGVVPGTHRVQISASKILDESKIKWFAPKKYSDFRKSGLSFDISESTDNLIIKLSWDGGKPFVD